MKIIINSAHQRFGGGVQVALSFINECIKYTEHEYHVFAGPGITDLFDEKDFPTNFKFYYFNFGVVNLLKSYKINNTLKKAEDRIAPDCIISTTGPSYFNSKTPQIIGFNLPLYIYPESPYLESLSFYRKIRLFFKKKFHFYFFKRDASAYVVQTDDVNKRVRNELSSNRVYTISNTYSSFYNDWSNYPLKLPERKLKQIRLLTVSSWYLHKNLEIIPKVLVELKRRGLNNIQFVLTVKEDHLQHILEEKQDKDILNVGPVDPKECPSLYDECDIMFLPTLAECFSASYPEAMVMEKPIITTNLGFAQSICGEAALYYDPKDPISAADKIELLIKDQKLWQDLVKNGKERLKLFDTPANRAEKYLHICKNIDKIKDNQLIELH